MSDTVKTITKDGWKLVLDKSEIFPDDPGQGTPAMVYAPNGDSATYNCATDTGEIGDYQRIPNSIHNWLLDKEDEVQEFLWPSG
jgi:hypothetical protein